MDVSLGMMFLDTYVLGYFLAELQLLQTPLIARLITWYGM